MDKTADNALHSARLETNDPLPNAQANDRIPVALESLMLDTSLADC